MSGRGRPLRFVALVAFGWASARTIMLWPEGASLPEAIEAAFPLRPTAAATPLKVERAQPVVRAPAAAPVTTMPLLLAGPVAARGDPDHAPNRRQQ